MRLLPVHSVADAATYLYALLLDREESQNISHKAIPAVDQHLAFVRSNPYREWYLIDVGFIVGAIYISKQNEIGVGVFKKDRGHGFARRAIEMLLLKHPGERLVANINPQNEASISLFSKLGSKLIQYTYEVPS